jgi:ABC-2 type transport system ATP-binding protein
MVPDEDHPPPSSNPADVILELSGVGKTFRTGARTIEALHDVTLQLRRGVVTGLIGPDGAGKTTLMRLAAGLLLPSCGYVTVLGMDTASDSLAVQAAIGYMPQRFGLYDDLSVQENLDLYADLQGVPRAARTERYRELMHMTGLAPFTERLAGRLSGGMKQKLGLACTLVRSPHLLLLDEPTVGVDPVSRRELWSIVYRLVRQEAVSVILSTAYLDEAERCHEVVLLHEGELLGQGPPDAFSAELAGRTWAITVPGWNKRALQQRLARAPGVLDAVIQGERVRVVTDTSGALDVDALLPDAGAAIVAVPPRFEDSLVAQLQQRRSGDSKVEPAASTRQTPDGCKRRAVIEVHHVQRRFGDFYAVRDVSFDVARGEVFGLLGANGAGKSTTFRMLCGLLPVSSGRLQVAGVDLRRAAAKARARIGYMSQKFSLYDDLTVEENIDFFSGIYGVPRERRDARKEFVLGMAGLAERRGSMTSILSGGWKQRLALGCAILHEPPILFLDEPTSGVDPIARRSFWSLIYQLSATGHTVFVSTHYMDEAEYCHRLALMNRGKIIALGAPAELKGEMQSYCILSLESSDPLESMKVLEGEPGITDVAVFGAGLHVRATEETAATDRIRRVLGERHIKISHLERIPPSMEDVFVSLIEEQERSAP